MGGWHLIDIRHVPLEGLAFKTVVRDLLMRPFWNRYQTSQALGMSTVECSRGPICANKLQPRGAW